MTIYRRCVKEEDILNELAKAIRCQRCILLIGLGLALPSIAGNVLIHNHLQDLLNKMLQWCIDHGIIKQKEIEDEFKSLLADGDLDKVERKLQEYLIDAEQRRHCINDILLQNQADVRYIYRLLAQIPFCAYLTTGFDEFLENEYNDLNAPLQLSKYYRNSIDDALADYQMKERFILKLHGDVANDNPEGLTLSNRIAKSRLLEAIIYPKQLRQLLADVHTLFIGFEAGTPDLEGLKSAINDKSDLKRWLLLPEYCISEQEAEQLWQKERIMALCYTDRDALVEFLKAVEKKADTPEQINVYISYVSNPKDNEMRIELQKHLDSMDYPGLEVIWDSGEIGAGQDKSTIKNRLENANVILSLISVDYLVAVKGKNMNREVKQAVQRHRRDEARVIPIIFRSCDWKHSSPFGRLAALPQNEIPIDLAPNRDQVFLEVAQGVKLAIQEWTEHH